MPAQNYAGDPWPHSTGYWPSVLPGYPSLPPSWTPHPSYVTISLDTLVTTHTGDAPVATATGKKPIVLQRQQQTEYDDQAAAIQEASRLAGKNDDEYVVYVPVAIVRPKKDVTVETLGA